MRNLSSALEAHLQATQQTLATCWHITREDEQVLGFTDHDKDIIVDGVLYTAAGGFTPTAAQQRAGLASAAMELQGILSHDALQAEDILAGRYDNAVIRIFLVNYEDPSMGIIVLRTGWLGEIQLQDGQFIAQLRGLSEKLNQRIAHYFSPTCRAELGDSACGVNLAALEVVGAITGIDGVILYDTSLSAPADYFSGGVMRITSGDNAGLVQSVRYYTPGQCMLEQAFPYTLQVGDAYILTPGCNKTSTTCKGRYANFLNFRGEPHIPGLDAMLTTAATR